MPHSTGHMLGIDVHDCAQARRENYTLAKLEPGMILTVEPGIYIHPDDEFVPPEYRGIGVRIEDDILVTKDGNINLETDDGKTLLIEGKPTLLDHIALLPKSALGVWDKGGPPEGIRTDSAEAPVKPSLWDSPQMKSRIDSALFKARGLAIDARAIGIRR